MKTRFCNLIQSPDAGEGALKESNYSTERSPTTALLFEAARTVLLPLVRLEDALPSVQVFLETKCKVGCSVQEQH
jgi:hypothetical protein